MFSTYLLTILKPSSSSIDLPSILHSANYKWILQCWELGFLRDVISSKTVSVIPES